MALFDEEPILTNKPQALDEMSVDELEERILALKEEISACEEEIEKKRRQKSAADALFGGSD